MVEGFSPLAKRSRSVKKLPQRFGHLFAVNDQMFGVQPEFHEGLAGGRFALRDFVFVVREGEVHAAGVNVQRVAQIFHGHGGTFDMPAGAAGADARLPEMFAGLGGFPQREIAGVVLLVSVGIHARAGFDAAQIDLGKLAVIGKFRDAVVDGAVAGVGEAFLLRAARSARPCLRCGRWRGRALRAASRLKRVHVFQERLNVFFGVFADADARGGGVGDDAVVHVGKVHHLEDTIAARKAGSAGERPGRRRCGNCRCARSRRRSGRRCRCGLRPYAAARRAPGGSRACCAGVFRAFAACSKLAILSDACGGNKALEGGRFFYARRSATGVFCFAGRRQADTLSSQCSSMAARR